LSAGFALARPPRASYQAPGIPQGESVSGSREREAEERRRRERLVASLRENLKRRKAQRRGRATDAEPGKPEGASTRAGEGWGDGSH
jgi:hypothetical protein